MQQNISIICFVLVIFHLFLGICSAILKVLSSKMDQAESRLIRWAFLKGNLAAGF
jgi:hypothetical protein